MKYELRQCVGSRLRRLSRIVDGYYRKCLLDFDITENQMSILFALSKLGKIEQGIIGQKFELERSSVSRSIKLLETRGLLTKTSQYRPEIKLSKKGENLVNMLIPPWEELMETLSSKLGDVGMNSIVELEKRLN